MCHNKAKRAIVVVHNAGIACDMDTIISLASEHDLIVIDDAAQGFLASYKGKHLGTIGDFGTLSFHHTKNIMSDMVGALMYQDSGLLSRAKVIRKCGTSRQAFIRGENDRYTWEDVDSAYNLSELLAALLTAQLLNGHEVTRRRLIIWDRYHKTFVELEADGLCQRPTVPKYYLHNAHIYYVLLPSANQRNEFIAYLKGRGIQATFHYVPLHNSPQGLRSTRV
jgi:dTDP-4-amino-4,6-dideoxygalactose transaminase